MVCCNPLPPTHCNRGECVSLDAILWWFRFHLFTRCGCSILFTSVLSQWYSMYGWMNIQDVMSGWFEVETEHQATGLATLATCHSPPFEKSAPVRFHLICWCIHLCIYKASPLPAYPCSSKKRTACMILKQSSPNFTFLTRSIDSFLKCPEILFCHVFKIASGHFPS